MLVCDPVNSGGFAVREIHANHPVCMELIMTTIVNPSIQGELDNLCGIYSLVNAVAYLYDGAVKRRRLKLALLNTFQQQWQLDELLAYGMDEQQLDYVINKGLQRGYYRHKFPLNFSKPLLSNKPRSLNQVFHLFHCYLKERPHQRLILFCTPLHWTLIYKIEAGRVFFFDSTHKKTASVSSFSYKRGGRYEIDPQTVYFIEQGGAT